MKAYFDDKTDAVEFANDLQKTFPGSCPSITTITPGRYVVSCVPGATALSLEDTGEALVASKFFETQVST